MKPIPLNAFFITILCAFGLTVLGIIVCLIIEYPARKDFQRRCKEEWTRKQAQRLKEKGGYE